MGNVKLINYIRDGMKKGYSKQELEKILKDNGWTNSEILEGFSQISKPSSTFSPNKTNALENFVKSAFMKGYSEEKIRQALLAKRWPIGMINSTIEKNRRPQFHEKIREKTHVGEGKSSSKKVIIYTLWFIIIGAVLSVSIGAFFYIQSMNKYAVTDPNTGEQVQGKCLQEDCSDMKDYIFNNLEDKIWLITILALSISLVIILIHAFVPQKEWVIWIADIIFFLYILFLLYMWFLA